MVIVNWVYLVSMPKLDSFTYLGREDGLARLTEARTKHVKFTKEKRAEAKRRAEHGRQMRGELAELEA